MTPVKNYLKNVTKSVAYAAQDVTKELMPNTADFLDSNKSFIVSTYATIRNPKTAVKRSVATFQESKVFKALDYGIRNTFEDLSTGNFYNKAREERDELKLSGMDMGDWDDLSEFGIDNDSDKGSSESSKEITDGDKAIVGAIESTTAASTDTTVNAIISSGKAQIKSSRANLGMMYMQNEKLFGGLHSDLSIVNTSLSTINGVIGKSLPNIDKNTSDFFTQELKLSNERNAILKEMLEMQRNQYKSAMDKEKEKQDKENSRKKYTWDSINSGGLPSFDEYFEAIKKNITNTISNYIPSFGEDSNILASFMTSPLKEVTKALVTGVIPATIKASTKELDKTFSGIFAQFIGRLANAKINDSGGILGLLSKFIGVKTEASTSINTNNYEKGPVPFDGITRKAITEVIPSILGRIEAKITGNPEQVFDYNNGRWIHLESARKKYKYIRESSIRSATNNFREFYKLDMIHSNDENEEERIRLAKEEFYRWIYKHNGVFNPKLSADKNDISPAEYPNLRAENDKYYKAICKSVESGMKTEVVTKGGLVKKGRYSGLITLAKDVLDAKMREERQYRDAENDNTIVQLFSAMNVDKHGKWDKERKTFESTKNHEFLKIRDDLGNNIFDYLKNINQELVWTRISGFEKLYELMSYSSVTTNNLINNLNLSTNNNTNDTTRTQSQHTFNMSGYKNIYKAAYDNDIYSSIINTSSDHTSNRSIVNRSHDPSAAISNKQQREKQRKQSNVQKAIKLISEGKAINLADFSDKDTSDYLLYLANIYEAGNSDDFASELNGYNANSVATFLENNFIHRNIRSKMDYKKAQEADAKKEKDKNEKEEKEKSVFRNIVDKIKDAGSIVGGVSAAASDAISNALYTADKAIYEMLFRAKIDDNEDDENGEKKEKKKYDGFLDMLVHKTNDIFKKMGKFFKEDIIGPFKKWLGIDKEWEDRFKKTLKGFGTSIWEKFIGSNKEALDYLRDKMDGGIKDIKAESRNKNREDALKELEKLNEFTENVQMFDKEFIKIMSSYGLDVLDYAGIAEAKEALIKKIKEYIAKNLEKEDLKDKVDKEQVEKALKYDASREAYADAYGIAHSEHYQTNDELNDLIRQASTIEREKDDISAGSASGTLFRRSTKSVRNAENAQKAIKNSIKNQGAVKTAADLGFKFDNNATNEQKIQQLIDAGVNIDSSKAQYYDTDEKLLTAYIRSTHLKGLAEQKEKGINAKSKNSKNIIKQAKELGFSDKEDEQFEQLKQIGANIDENNKIYYNTEESRAIAYLRLKGRYENVGGINRLLSGIKYINDIKKLDTENASIKRILSIENESDRLEKAKTLGFADGEQDQIDQLKQLGITDQDSLSTDQKRIDAFLNNMIEKNKSKRENIFNNHSIINKAKAAGFKVGDKTAQLNQLKKLGVTINSTTKRRLKSEEARAKAYLEKINNPDGHAKGSNEYYTGRTALSKGELVIPKNGNIYEVPKTDVYDVNDSAIISNKDVAKLSGRGKDKYIPSKYHDKDMEDAAIHKYKKNKIGRHADGTLEIKNIGANINKEELVEEAKANIPEAAAGGLVGGILSMVLGLVGGPLAGAAIGAGAGILSSSNNLKDKLFGKVGEDGKRTGEGFFNKKLVQMVQKYAPEAVKGGMVGIIPGMMLGMGPIGGLIAGAGIGIIKSSSEIKEKLFGEGNLLKLTNKDKKVIEDMLPGALKGAALGTALTFIGLGPFGLLTNAALGAGLGMMSSTEDFKDMLFGKEIDGVREGGMFGVIKDAFQPLKTIGTKLVDDVFDTLRKNVVEPLQEFVQPFIHQIPHIVGFLPKAFNKIIKFIDNHIGNRGILRKVVTGTGKLASFVATAPLKAVTWLPGKIVKRTGKALRRRQMKKGTADYMTAGERMSWRERNGDLDNIQYDENGNAVEYNIDGTEKDLTTSSIMRDDMLANIGTGKEGSLSIAEANLMKKYLNYKFDTTKSLDSKKNKVQKDLKKSINSFEVNGVKLSDKAKREILKETEKGNFDKLPKIISKYSMSDGSVISEDIMNKLLHGDGFNIMDKAKSINELDLRYKAIRNGKNAEEMENQEKALAQMLEAKGIKGLDFSEMKPDQLERFLNNLNTELQDRKDRGIEDKEIDPLEENTSTIVDQLNDMIKLIAGIALGEKDDDNNENGKSAVDEIMDKVNKREEKANKAEEKVQNALSRRKITATSLLSDSQFEELFNNNYDKNEEKEKYDDRQNEINERQEAFNKLNRKFSHKKFGLISNKRADSAKKQFTNAINIEGMKSKYIDLALKVTPGDESGILKVAKVLEKYVPKKPFSDEVVETIAALSKNQLSTLLKCINNKFDKFMDDSDLTKDDILFMANVSTERAKQIKRSLKNKVNQHKTYKDYGSIEEACSSESYSYDALKVKNYSNQNNDEESSANNAAETVSNIANNQASNTNNSTPTPANNATENIEENPDKHFLGSLLGAGASLLGSVGSMAWNGIKAVGGAALGAAKTIGGMAVNGVKAGINGIKNIVSGGNKELPVAQNSQQQIDSQNGGGSSGGGSTGDIDQDGDGTTYTTDGDGNIIKQIKKSDGSWEPDTSDQKTSFLMKLKEKKNKLSEKAHNASDKIHNLLEKTMNPPKMKKGFTWLTALLFGGALLKTGILPKVLKTLAPIGKALFNNVLVPAWTDYIWPGLKTLWTEYIKPGVRWLWDTIKEYAPKIFNWIKDGLSWAWNNVAAPILSDIGEKIVDYYKGHLKNIVENPAATASRLGIGTDPILNPAEYAAKKIVEKKGINYDETKARLAEGNYQTVYEVGGDYYLNELKKIDEKYGSNFYEEEIKNRKAGKGKYGRSKYSKQIDPSIANYRYNAPGDNEYQTIKDSGCGPTAAVNALEAMYGRGNNVLDAANYAIANGYKEIDGGTRPEFFTRYFNNNGISSKYTTNKSILANNIMNGNPTVLMGKDPNGVSNKNPYGEYPHYVTVTGMKGGYAVVQDPESIYDDELYPMDEVLSKSSFGVSAYGTGKRYRYGRAKIHTNKPIYGRGKAVNNKKYIFLGDSRTVQMKAAIDPEGKYNTWICKGSMGYNWMINNAFKQIPVNINNSKIIILFGVNDAADYSKAKLYCTAINKNAIIWKNSGASVYFVSVNPLIDKIYDKKYNKVMNGHYSNKDIKKFNKYLKENLSNNVTFIDTYDEVNKNIDSSDGLHYTNKVYEIIYDLIINAINESKKSKSTNSNYINTGSITTNGNASTNKKGGILNYVSNNSRMGKIMALFETDEENKVSSYSNSISTNTSDNSNDSKSKASTAVAGSSVDGTDARSMVWNYLISHGYSKAAAAGAMGNIEHEVGRTNKSVFKKASGSYVNSLEWDWGGSEYDAISNAGNAGGLLQWTPWEKTIGAYSKKHYGSETAWAKDINVQLEYMDKVWAKDNLDRGYAWTQGALTGAQLDKLSLKSYSQFKNTNDPVLAAKHWQAIVENPSHDTSINHTDRRQGAAKWYYDNMSSSGKGKYGRSKYGGANKQNRLLVENEYRSKPMIFKLNKKAKTTTNNNIKTANSSFTFYPSGSVALAQLREIPLEYIDTYVGKKITTLNPVQLGSLNLMRIKYVIDRANEKLGYEHFHNNNGTTGNKYSSISVLEKAYSKLYNHSDQAQINSIAIYKNYNHIIFIENINYDKDYIYYTSGDNFNSYGILKKEKLSKLIKKISMFIYLPYSYNSISLNNDKKSTKKKESSKSKKSTSTKSKETTTETADDNNKNENEKLSIIETLTRPIANSRFLLAMNSLETDFINNNSSNISNLLDGTTKEEDDESKNKKTKKEKQKSKEEELKIKQSKKIDKSLSSNIINDAFNNNGKGKYRNSSYGLGTINQFNKFKNNITGSTGKTKITKAVSNYTKQYGRSTVPTKVYYNNQQSTINVELINTIINILMTIADNTDKLNLIVSILNEKLNINISASDINSKTSKDNLKSKLKNSFNNIILNQNNDSNVNVDPSLINIINAVNTIASE